MTIYKYPIKNKLFVKNEVFKGRSRSNPAIYHASKKPRQSSQYSSRGVSVLSAIKSLWQCLQTLNILLNQFI